MNAMPHFVLGIWKARMFSAFGFGNTKNILYGVLNFIISLGLFLYKYGGQRLAENGIYATACRKWNLRRGTSPPRHLLPNRLVLVFNLSQEILRRPKNQ